MPRRWRRVAPANSDPILDTPPLVRDVPDAFAAAPVALVPLDRPAYSTAPVADTFLAETDRPDAVAESTAKVAFAEPAHGRNHGRSSRRCAALAAQATAPQAAVAFDDDDPLGFSDGPTQYAKQTALVRRRKKGIPVMFFIGPLLGIGAVVAAVVYSNLRDAMQAELDAVQRDSHTATRHPSVDTASISSKPHSSTKPSAELRPPAFSFSPSSGPNQDFAAPPAAAPAGSDSPPAAQNPSPESKPTDEHPEENKPTPARLPVPGAGEQHKALVEIKKIHKEEFSKAINVVGREALIKKLSDEATATKDDPTMRYVLATQALDEAVQICDVKMASGSSGRFVFLLRTSIVGS